MITSQKRIDADALPASYTRISVERCAARWSDRPISVADAMDFWSFAAGAANVIMQLSWPGVGHGVAESKVDFPATCSSIRGSVLGRLSNILLSPCSAMRMTAGRTGRRSTPLTVT